MWWGWLCAMVAAVAYGVASVLQAMGARAVDEGAPGVDPRLLLRVFRQWRYVVGTGLDLVGFVAQLIALRVLPLFAVQAALAASLAVTAVVAASAMGARLRSREWTAVVLVCAGLALLGASARTEGSAPTGFGFHLALVCATAVIGIAGAIAGRTRDPVRTPALGLVAGLGFALVALAGRIVSTHSVGALLSDPATYTIACAGILAMLFYASALQRGSVTTATALMVIGETVLPSLIGVLALGDTTRSGFAILAVAGFALAVVAALALARFGEVP